jgi:hypothetical protein
MMALLYPAFTFIDSRSGVGGVNCATGGMGVTGYIPAAISPGCM